MTTKKIFGIGMPRTGTLSLHHALQILGIKSFHFAHDPATISEIENGQYKLSILMQYDALLDIPVPAIFAQLDSVWPGSKFILTVRDLPGWLDSCRNAFFNVPSAMPTPDNFRYFYRAMLYGSIAYNEERFKWVYETHTKLVMDHFSSKGTTNQLLVMDIASGDGWEKLCPFLGLPIPSQPFPHSNARTGKP